jgi:argininosuccinate lyase
VTSDLLGFSGPTGNTYGSIATVDYLLESTSAAAVMLTGLGRFVQDVLLWCTVEFGYLRLADGFVQTSSIMPQKRNPVALEHARAIASKALGQASAIMLAVHNTPFGDVVDTEDDLQPLVFATFRDATRVVKLVAAAMASAEFDTGRLEARAAEGWTTLTELADTLVRDHGLPFRSAHAVASALVSRRAQDPATPLSDLLVAASSDIAGKQVRYTDSELAEILSPRHFVDVRRTHGGPSPVEVDRALDQSRDRLLTDQRWWADAMDALKGAEQRLGERAATL